MQGRNAGVSRFLSDSEVNFLRFGLRLEATSILQKRTLQSLCEFYEVGRQISDAAQIRQMIHSHLGAKEAVVRRWAMKALALIGHPDDFSRIVDRLRVESDVEAQTWGVAGLVKNGRELGFGDLCAAAGLDRSSALALAARLYAPGKWLESNAEPHGISLQDDQLTLKWATFLIGYGRAPEDLFDPRHPNELFLGELNNHDAPEISEYSIWALWERKEFSAGFCKIPLAEADKHPESVRKWLYRLATKSPELVGLDADALGVLRRDESVRAREGLALGAIDLNPTMFAKEIGDWYSTEPSPQVQEYLLASMASRSAEERDYADLVELRFGREQVDSGLRRRLLAASIGTPLYQNLKAIDMSGSGDRQGLLMYDRPPIVIVKGDNYMSGPTLNVGGSLNAQNVAVGDMINSANAAIQRLERTDAGTVEVLRDVLAMLGNSPTKAGGAELVAAVEKIAKEPTAENKDGLVETLRGFGAKAAALGSAVVGIDKLIEAAQHIHF